MMVEDDQELDNAVPYRIVCEDGLPHVSRSFFWGVFLDSVFHLNHSSKIWRFIAALHIDIENSIKHYVSQFYTCMRPLLKSWILVLCPTQMFWQLWDSNVSFSNQTSLCFLAKDSIGNRFLTHGLRATAKTSLFGPFKNMFFGSKTKVIWYRVWWLRQYMSILVGGFARPVVHGASLWTCPSICLANTACPAQESWSSLWFVSVCHRKWWFSKELSQMEYEIHPDGCVTNIRLFNQFNGSSIFDFLDPAGAYQFEANFCVANWLVRLECNLGLGCVGQYQIWKQFRASMNCWLSGLDQRYWMPGSG